MDDVEHPLVGALPRLGEKLVRGKSFLAHIDDRVLPVPPVDVPAGPDLGPDGIDGDKALLAKQRRPVGLFKFPAKRYFLKYSAPASGAILLK